jgi:hypothetical protein
MQIWKTYQTDEGDELLIPHEKFNEFMEDLSFHKNQVKRAKKGEILFPEEHESDQEFVAEGNYDSFLDSFERLEGRAYCIVFEEDI